ncbi:DNA polymerase Y family protein [Methylobacterium sp. J-076]|uniref:DNA polymerase Y family protein n=1 Tax=Methylobacterium sp. J-076 TaxID=2836655 RepID=UPI001FB9F7F7|nr:DNA polymerase Y family protein [Methylobacterium sp. J-076]MCJ2015481.1 DNA polymerase Y family protein [Methylobacterium sp. J-076]
MTRLRRAGLAPEDGPHAVAAAGPGGLRLVALDGEAYALGLRPGELLGRVRARIGVPLHVHPADPEAEMQALHRLCRWAMRYAPVVAPFGPAETCHGLYLDTEGAAHLFGGEAALLDDLAGRLARARIPARLALADTPGAAYAVARFGKGKSPEKPAHTRDLILRRRHPGGGLEGGLQNTPRSLKPSPGAADAAPQDEDVWWESPSAALEPSMIVPPGEHAAHLATLPVEALRLEADAAAGLRRLGLRRVADVEALPRAGLARRFGLAPLLRLDQAHGRRPEPLSPLAETRTFSGVRGFLDPIGRQGDVVAAARSLMEEIAPRLERAGLGACALRLTLHRVDGTPRTLEIGLSRPERSPERIASLVRLRLERLGAGLDAGFGFETVGLTVTSAETMDARQAELGGAGTGERVAGLADILAQRIGRRLVRLAPQESHLPERAEGVVPWVAPPLPYPRSLPARPLVLFAQGEAAHDVFAAAPDGPPHRFRWRAREYRVARAEGPERIAPEWWRGGGAPRDYYRIECEIGRRLWLYRDGPHGPERPAAWFVHGMFP